MRSTQPGRVAGGLDKQPPGAMVDVSRAPEGVMFGAVQTAIRSSPSQL
jgi:hypothetical protein